MDKEVLKSEIKRLRLQSSELNVGDDDEYASWLKIQRAIDCLINLLGFYA